MAVRYERIDSIALITIDRPQALNAVNADLAREIGEAWARFMAEDDAAVAVLTGAGRAFCAGIDMKFMADAVRDGQDVRMPSTHAPRGLLKPTIAAVNGPAAGSGVTMALDCDITICSENAVFVLPFAARGLGGVRMVLEVARRTSYKTAMYLATTAQRIDATTALRLGLVQEVLPADELLPRAIDLAERIAGYAPSTMRLIKAHLLDALDVGYAAVLDRIQLDGGIRVSSANVREGVLAYDEKRRAQFTE